MGLGFSKILLSKEIPHYKVSDFFSFICNPSEPGIGHLLGSLCHTLGSDDLFFVHYASIIYHCFSSLVLIFVPGVLRAVVTKVSLLMTGVTLNFIQVLPWVTWPLSSPLEESSMWHISPTGHISSMGQGAWVYFLTSCNSSPSSSSQGVHGIWADKLSVQHPSTSILSGGSPSTVCS